MSVENSVEHSVKFHDDLDDERFDLRRQALGRPLSPIPINEYANKLKTQLDISRDHHDAFEGEAIAHAGELRKLETNTSPIQKSKHLSPASGHYRSLHEEYQRSVHERMDQDVVKVPQITIDTFQPPTEESKEPIIGDKEPITITVNDALLGLTDQQVEESRLEHGYNEITEKKTSPIIKFLMYFTGSIAFLIEIAVILSGVLKDWVDFGVILGLLFVNAIIGFVEEQKAESAVDALKNTLALKSKVIRNGKLTEIESKLLVPGDIIDLRMGEIIPADAQLLCITSKGQESKVGLSIDQSGLTGESLPVNKKRGDGLMSSSIVKNGHSLAIVKKIGEKTFIGRAAHLISISKDAGHFQKLIGKIGNILIAVTLIMVLILVFVTIFAQNRATLDSIQYALVLVIASIPVGLPTVMSVTMAVGAKQLAKKNCIVKKLSAVEQMASISILCSDKTGTLTQNKLTIDRPFLAESYTETDLMLTAFLASEAGNSDAIESCIRDKACQDVPELKGIDPKTSHSFGDYTQLAFHPFDPVSKLTRAVILYENNIICVAKGAPQVIMKLCNCDSEDARIAVSKMARAGLRALGVCRSQPVEATNENKKTLESAENPSATGLIKWEFVGLLSLLDPPRLDSAETLKRCKEYGLIPKMVTGDALLIAKEVAKRLGINRNILPPRSLVGTDEEVIPRIVKCDGFAQVVPEDKYRVVELLQKGNYRVAMTGDGVNDAPALKKAEVGIAVHGATDAARSAASIVLLEPGLSAIVDAILTSRAIFQRMRSYALYRITSTIHFLIFLFIAIIGFDFFIKPVLIVFITLLNDAATVVISWDNACISKKPDKWRLGQLVTMSVIMGVLLAGWSLGHYTIGRYVLESSDDVLGTVMYLQLSSSPHFVIFSTRVEGYFWKNKPSLIFFTAIFGTQVFAMFISIFGAVSAPCGWAYGIVIMLTSLIFFTFLDIIKVQVYKHWSYELTVKLVPTKARKLELARRKEILAIKHRVQKQFNKIRAIIKIIRVAMDLNKYQRIPGDSLKLYNVPINSPVHRIK